MVGLYIAAWVVQVVLTIGVPILVGVWYTRRYRVGLTPFMFGAAVFLVFQMLTRIPGVQVLSAALGPHLVGHKARQIVYLAFLALTAGLFESVGRWVGYRFMFPNRVAYTWRNAVAYGIGHAGIESVGLVGLTQAINLAVTVLVLLVGVERLGGVLPAALMEQLASIPDQIARLPWHLPLAGGLERVFTIPLHTAMSLVVLLAFTQKRAYWLWVAVGVHALMDLTGPGLLQFAPWPIWMRERFLHMWAVELYLGVWAAVSLWFIVRMRRWLPEGDEAL